MAESNPSRPELVKGEPIQPDLVVTTEVVEAARDRHDEIVRRAEGFFRDRAELRALMVTGIQQCDWYVLGFANQKAWINDMADKLGVKPITILGWAKPSNSKPHTRQGTPSQHDTDTSPPNALVAVFPSESNLEQVRETPNLKSHLNALLTCSPDDVTTFIAATSKRASCERAAKRLRQYAAQFDLRARSLPDD